MSYWKSLLIRFRFEKTPGHTLPHQVSDRAPSRGRRVKTLPSCVSDAILQESPRDMVPFSSVHESSGARLIEEPFLIGSTNGKLEQGAR